LPRPAKKELIKRVKEALKAAEQASTLQAHQDRSWSFDVGTILISERFARIYVCSATPMDRFNHRKKLEHHLRLLTQTTDEAQRQQLMKLLAEEETTAQQPPREGGKQEHP
jgi:hypothetical protein